MMAESKFVPVLFAGEEITQVEKDYENARRLGNVLVGEWYLFYPSLLRMQYIPIQNIAWAYMRCENNFCSIGCRRAMLPSFLLMIVLSTGARKKISCEDDAQVKEILDELKEKNNGITVGYTKKLEERFKQ